MDFVFFFYYLCKHQSSLHLYITQTAMILSRVIMTNKSLFIVYLNTHRNKLIVLQFDHVSNLNVPPFLFFQPAPQKISRSNHKKLTQVATRHNL